MDIGRMIEDLLPEYERARLSLPSAIMSYEVSEFMTLIDQAFIEVEYSHNGGNINTNYWMNKLKQLSPDAYKIVMRKESLEDALELIANRVRRDDNLDVILIMLGAADVSTLKRSIQRDEVMLLSLMMSKEPLDLQVKGKIVFEHFYLSAIYLLQHEAKITQTNIQHMLTFEDTPSEARSELVIFLANHLESYNGEHTFLDWFNRDTGTMYSLILDKDPLLAVQLLGTSVTLDHVYFVHRNSSTYLHDAISHAKSLMESQERTVDIIKHIHAYQQIIMTLVKRYPKLMYAIPTAIPQNVLSVYEE